MSEPFIAEIRLLPFTFAPRGWAFCHGQLLPISQNTALFSLIGTSYGGDGRTTTALPDLQGRAPMHPGRGPGLSTYRLGEPSGVEAVTLIEATMPKHNHSMRANQTGADQHTPTSAEIIAEGHKPGRSGGISVDLYNTSADATMNAETLALNGGGQAHDNMQPFLAINFCIALQGLYPSRN